MIEDLVGGEGAPTGMGRTWKLGARGKHQSEMMSSAPAEKRLHFCVLLAKSLVIRTKNERAVYGPRFLAVVFSLAMILLVVDRCQRIYLL